LISRRRSPDPGDRISVEGGDRTQERQLLDHRLRDEHPIERIAVMKRQRRDLEDVAPIDRQHNETVSIKPISDKAIKRLG
jgi:hypothetical protein